MIESESDDFSFLSIIYFSYGDCCYLLRISVWLYRSEKSSQILKRRTGNLKENKSTEDGVVEVGQVELEVVCCPSDDCRVQRSK